ncbi:hypothetical protein K2173_006795 [Erythroxylum novogranatense]|uniref:Leucine-rich repeat-containing N-terminal plant-type domain-containing protein n=1 Tax=Erythroxylum novogranatense TaxID=1862640 RepID=A0AAV8SZ13_9ROSI|nr:hypothetical protein K2173_006795 [Erythroxylum novogranatense]
MKGLKAYDVMPMFLMLSICCYFGWCGGCSDDERRALQHFMDSMGYQDTEGDDDCCLWDGVDCNPTNTNVVQISFYYVWKESESQPGSVISEEESLWFPDMNLLSEIKELQQLHLRGNQIGGLHNPEALCRLPNLKLLDLSYNLIQDDLYPCFANMSALRILDLSYNRFQGDLSILSNISNIETVDVSHNNFEGHIPLSVFANLSKLSYLDLSYNKLHVESESPNWHPSFQIRDLHLADCNLSNHQIPRFISTQYYLDTLDLSNNLLGGSFPAWMFHNVSSTLRLRGNLFTYRRLDGPLPSNINVFLPKLQRFNASSCQLTGSIPPSLGGLQNLEQLDLSDNSFSGVIPNSLTKDSPLRYLNLANNGLIGDLLPRDCNMTELRWLLLSNNHFVGNMPTCLSNSPSLLMLDAKRNYLAGDLANQMQLMAQNQTAVFAGQKPIFSQMGTLLLGFNHFSGQIPRLLCEMQKLQFLDLSNNSFSGSIPSCFNNNLLWGHKFQANSWVPTDFTTKGNLYCFMGIPLTEMTGIDFSANKLTDTIPIQLGELQDLHSFNLSHNLLSGEIPSSFGNLKEIESLDLSHNRLTGTIPQEIVHISTLTTFFVAFNDLSGRIPFYDHFTTFTEISFVGNPKLCGPPLEREFLGDDNHVNPGDETEENQTVNPGDETEENPMEEDRFMDKPVVFYSFVFMAFSLGFWSVVLPVFFSRNWRRKFYGTIDKWLNHRF